MAEMSCSMLKSMTIPQVMPSSPAAAMTLAFLKLLPWVSACEAIYAYEMLLNSICSMSGLAEHASPVLFAP
eukprot:3561715-Karenia_brevis.AAC.1